MINQPTVSEIERLNYLYREGFRSNYLDVALRKILTHQIERDRHDLEQIQAALRAFETQYHLSSQIFWQQYAHGEISDTADFMEWNVLWKMEHRLLSRLKILEGDLSHG